MANQHQSAKGQADKQSQPKNRPEVVNEPMEEQLAAGGLPGGVMAAGDSSVEGQAARLADLRFAAVQRQAMAAQIGRVAGNRYLQRVINEVMRVDEAETGGETAVELGEGNTAAPAAAAGATPSFDYSGGQTVTIDADTAPDFSQKITAQIGSPHVTPEFTPDVQYDFKTNAAGARIPGTEKITSVGLSVKAAITKVRLGLSRANDKHREAINQMVAAIKAHEEAHRAIIEAEATAALTAAQKYVGTNKVKEAEKALSKTLECTCNKRHEALDATEGLLTAAEQTDGSVTVSKSGSGAKYPCPK
jgi:hypothetical protein